MGGSGALSLSAMPEHHLVGPVPPGRDPDEYDRQRRRILWLMPSGLYVLGSAADGRRNLMTLNWATQVSSDPKLVAVSVEAGAVTAGLVVAGGGFTVNLIRRADRAVVRKFVKPLHDAGEPGHLAGFEVRAASTGAPVLALAAAWLDCRLVQTVDLGSHRLFLGEVVDCGPLEPPAAPDGTVADADAGDGDAILRMEDTRMNYGG